MLIYKHFLKRIAHKWLSSQLLPPFAIEELEKILQVIQSEETYVWSGVKSIITV